MAAFRSFLFLAFMWISIPVATIIFLLLIPIDYKHRSKLIAFWSKINLKVLSLTCDLQHEISGLDNIPKKPCIIFCKHQSTWETMALQLYFTPQVWILKRELMWIPFFGWTLASMKSIAINRSNGKQAMKKILEQGTKRLQEGNWIIIFPEGTRTLPGQKPDYKMGGALLARHSGFDILPIAHNAGEFWPKGQFIKKPGTIKMVIGPLIQCSNKSAKKINQEAETWIENTVNNLYEQQY